MSYPARSKMLRKILAVVCIANTFVYPIFFTGCHVSRATIYPDFVRQKNDLGAVTVLSDIMLIEALRGDTSKIDVVENEDIAVSELQMCADHLREKGYMIQNTTLTSIGLLMNPGQIYKVARTQDDVNLREDVLPMAYPPFYVDPLIRRDSMVEMSLARLYTSVLNIGQRQDTERTYIASARVLGRHIGAKTIMILLTGGFNVPITKGVMEPTEPTNRGEKTVAVRPRSQISMLLYIVNAVTGEVVWEDRVFKNEGVVHKKRILDMLEGLLEDLP